MPICFEEDALANKNFWNIQRKSHLKNEFYIFIKNWYFQITYHELESFNGEQQLGRSEFVSDPIFPLSNLLPGRNYSISVQAVSKGVESVERSIFQVWPLKKFSFGCFLSVKINPCIQWSTSDRLTAPFKYLDPVSWNQKVHGVLQTNTTNLIQLCMLCLKPWL